VQLRCPEFIPQPAGEQRVGKRGLIWQHAHSIVASLFSNLHALAPLVFKAMRAHLVGGFDAVTVVVLEARRTDLLSEHILSLLALVSIVPKAARAHLVRRLDTDSNAKLEATRTDLFGCFHAFAPLVFKAVGADLFGEFRYGAHALVVIMLGVAKPMRADFVDCLHTLIPFVLKAKRAYLGSGLDAHTVLFLKAMRTGKLDAFAVLLVVAVLAFAVVKVVVALATKDAIRVGWTVEVVVAFINALAVLLVVAVLTFAVVEVVVAGSSWDLAGMIRAAVRAFRAPDGPSAAAGYQEGEHNSSGVEDHECFG